MPLELELGVLPILLAPPELGVLSLAGVTSQVLAREPGVQGGPPLPEVSWPELEEDGVLRIVSYKSSKGVIEITPPPIQEI